VFFSAVVACSLRASEDAGTMLKVPPAGDRPVGDAVPSTEAKEAQTAPSPSTSPSPEPGQNPSAPDAPAAEPSAEAIVPEPYPVSRYASLWENSPFQIESIAPPQQSEGLAQRFVLGGILRENGEPVVWVRERATQQSYKVARNSTNSLGLSLVEVSETMDKQSDATATIRLGGELGVIKFDVAATGAAPGIAMPPPMARPPMMPTPVRPPQPAPGRVPGQTGTAMPGSPPQQIPVNPAIAQPGIVPPVPGPGVPQGGQIQAPGQEQMPPPRVIRRRAIVPATP
jgi:hypothetical protein